MDRVSAAKTVRITIETETRIVVRRAKVLPAWCPNCQKEVEVIVLAPVQEVTPETGSDDEITESQLQQWLGTGKLHLWQTAGSPVQICVPSLLQCFDSAKSKQLSQSTQELLDLFRRKDQ